MSHAVESMAFAGATPWHGLGVKVEDDLTPEQIMTTAGLDWTVSKRKLAFGGLAGPEAILEAAPDLKDIDNRYALVRDTDGQFLDIVGKVYRPTQNKDAFEFFDSFVKEGNLKMHTAGSLCKGKYVWALAETSKSFTIGPDKDKVESYILLVSPHQFGRSLIVQETTVRVVCQNTLNLAITERGGASYRMTHGREFNNKSKKEAAEVIGLASDSFTKFEEHVNILADAKVTRLGAIDFYSQLLGIKDGADQDDNGLPKSRMLKAFMDAYEGGSPGADLSGAKGTLWGAVNGVTFVLDHVAVRDKENAMRDNIFGYRGDLKRKALNIALKIAA